MTGRWRRRIRTRLALASAGSAALVLLVVGISIGALTQRADLRAADAVLRERADAAPWLARQATLADEDSGLADPALRGLVGGFQVLLPDGRVVAGGALPEATIPIATGPSSTVEVAGRRWRLLTIPVGESIVQLAEPVDPADTSDRRSDERLVLLASLAAAAAAGGVGWLVGGRIARPLTRLRDEATAIRAGADLERRVAVDARVVEVHELAEAFNDTLRRLGAEARRSAVALGASRGFAAAAAHELRTPLATVGAHLEILARHPDLPAERRAEILHAATSEHERLARVISGLRDLARADLAEPSWFEPCDLGDLVVEAVAEAAGDGEDRVDVRVPERLALVAWPAGLRLAVTNLVANALRHAGLPGREPRVVVTARDECEEIVVTVDDDGPGVPPHLRERVLEPFERGTATKAGTGLGLAIASQQARLHDGQLVLGEAPLGGMRATVRLPWRRPR